MPAQGILIRLYVGIPEEARSEETLREVADKGHSYFDGMTMYDAHGVWHGQLESSLVIEIATSGQGKEELARMFADDLRIRFDQESVLMTVQNLGSFELIE